MPPSGYTAEQTNSLSFFLESVCNSLIEEGKAKNLSPLDALKNECNNINIIQNSDSIKSFQQNTLLITKEFYQELIKKKPKSYDDLLEKGKINLSDFKKNILEIHVPPI